MNTNNAGEQEIERIGNEAANDETIEVNAQQEAQTQYAQVNNAGVAEEFTEVLNLLAMVAGHGMGVNVAARFTPQANLEIAKAAVTLCEKYGKDPRSLLIGADSVVGAWLGLAFTLGVPSIAVYRDYKVMKAKTVEAANDDTIESAA